MPPVLRAQGLYDRKALMTQAGQHSFSLQRRVLLEATVRPQRPFTPHRPTAWRLPSSGHCKPLERYSLARREAKACCSRRTSIVIMASMTVTVTGAGGRTGKLILRKLLAQPDKFSARGLVRDEKAVKSLEADGIPADQLFAGDILEDAGALKRSLQGADALVIATSGVPQIKPLSLIGVFWKKLLRQEGARPEFKFKKDQDPEQIDWLGQKAQIDAAKEAGVKKVVLISSMGGTDENNPLNKLGNGRILLWKRISEEYLIDSGAFEYTIIHPGGLTDEEGGKRELVLGVDDELLKRPNRSIPRADVAELAVQSLTLSEAKNRSIDAIAKEPGDGQPTLDFASLFGSLKQDCKYGPGSVKALTSA